MKQTQRDSERYISGCKMNSGFFILNLTCDSGYIRLGNCMVSSHLVEFIVEEGFPGGSVMNPPAYARDVGLILGQKDPLE